MADVPKLADMRRGPGDSPMPLMMGAGPEYPSGLCIHLSKAELDKLGLGDDAEVGDILHLHAMARVTAVSSSDHETMGADGSVSLQITDMSVEDEAEEDDDAEKSIGDKRRRKLYG